MIVNAGLKRVISMMKNGKIKVFNIADWVKEWREQDIIDDQYQYGTDQEVEKLKQIKKN